MKRHPSLAPLSREHHTALILAQLLKENAPEYKGLPVDTEGKIAYAVNIFKNSLQDHFAKEESVLEKIRKDDIELIKLAEEIKAEHLQLTQMFLGLESSTIPKQSMHELGITLEEHIRKEERVLFPMIESKCSETEFEEISLLLA